MSAKPRFATPKKTRTSAAQEAFLESFAEHGIIARACKDAGIERSTVYRWKEHSETFLLRYNQAMEDAKDNIKAEIYRRARDGWDEEVYQMGHYAGTVHKYSDTLLIFHAKMLMPEYRDKQQLDVNATVSSTVKHDISDELRMLTSEQLAQFRSWLESAKERT